MPKLPVLSGKKLVTALKKAGFVEVRQRGSHISMQKVIPEKTFKTIVPLHKEVAKSGLRRHIRITATADQDASLLPSSVPST